MILSILDTEWKRQLSVRSLIYTVMTIFFAAVGLIYDRFSLSGKSEFMTYAFLFPLLLGVLPYHIVGLMKTSLFFRHMKQDFWLAGVLTLSMGAIFRGIVEIAGVSSNLGKIYWVAGGALCILSIAGLMLSKNK